MLVTQSYRTLCDPVVCRLPGSSVHGILQARILEWVAIAWVSWTWVSCIGGQIVYHLSQSTMSPQHGRRMKCHTFVFFRISACTLIHTRSLACHLLPPTPPLGLLFVLHSPKYELISLFLIFLGKTETGWIFFKKRDFMK